MKVICPHCNKEFEIAPQLCGEKVRCGDCDLPFRVPLPLGILPGIKPPYRLQDLNDIAGLLAGKVMVYFLFLGIFVTVLLFGLSFLFRR